MSKLIMIHRKRVKILKIVLESSIFELHNYVLDSACNSFVSVIIKLIKLI